MSYSPFVNLCEDSGLLLGRWQVMWFFNLVLKHVLSSSELGVAGVPWARGAELSLNSTPQVGQSII